MQFSLVIVYMFKQLSKSSLKFKMTDAGGGLWGNACTTIMCKFLAIALIILLRLKHEL